MLEKLPNDSVAARHLTPDLRKILKGLSGGDTSTLVQNEVFSIMEIAVCGVISTTNITLSGSQTIDGFSSDLYELICVNGQTTQTENGIYLPRAGAWERWEGATAGQLIRVLNGTVNGLTWWNNDNSSLDIGTTNITYSYLLSEASIATLTDVNLTGLSNGQILLYDSTSGKWINSDYAGLPAGTVDSAIMSYDITTGLWTERTKIQAQMNALGTTGNYIYILPNSGNNRITAYSSTNKSAILLNPVVAITANLEANATETFLSLDSNGGTGKKTQIIAKVANQYIILNHASDNFLDIYADGTLSRTLYKSAANSYLSMRSYHGGGATDIMISHYWNGTNRFSVNQSGTILSDTLTASTVLVANASKEIVSLANPATDKILAFESGVLVWVDKPSGGTPQVNSDWDAVSGVEEILNKPTIPAAQIQSDYTQTDIGAVDYIKNKPTIPTDISDLTDTTLLIPENHVGFNVDGIGAFQIYQNLNSGATTLVDMTNMYVTLPAAKYYQMNVVLVLEFAHVDYADNVEFELCVVGTSTVVNYAIFRQNSFSFGDSTGQTTNQMAINTAKAFIKTGGTDGFTNRVLSGISGVVYSGASGGVLKLQARVTGSGEPDGTLIMKVLGGSTINAIETAIN